MMNQILDCFNIVWETVYKKHFDPSFGGLDWHEVYARYHPQVAAIKDDKTFYELVNKMLFELNVSHLAVVPPEEKDLFDPILCANGCIGIDLRLLEKEAVITAVEPGAPADMAGFRPGLIVRKINDKSIQQLTDEVSYKPPFHDRNEETQISINIKKQVYGKPGNPITLVYIDESGKTNEAVIHCAARGGKVVLGENLPACFVEFDTRRLENGIGYIRFNAFIPPVQDYFAEALVEFNDMRALIIDIRGNHGGVWPVRKILAENLVSESALFCRYRSRERTNARYLEPVENPYTGSLALLVDVLSMSSAEEFAGSLQTNRRGVIVGERTPGICVVCDFMELPNGALFMFPVEQSITRNGTVLEGHGVIPDIKVALDRTQLLQGIDTQLMAAIRHLKSEKRG